MYITKFRVQNFKSYLDSNDIVLKPGFNLITGQNSAGKTALLEAMTLDLTDNPHRSLKTVPIRGRAPSLESIVRVTFSITRDDLLTNLGNQNHLLPRPQTGFVIPGNSPYQPGVNEPHFLRWLFQEREYLVALTLRRLNGGDNWEADGRPLGKYPTGPAAPDGSLEMLIISIDARGEVILHPGVNRSFERKYLATDMSGPLRAKIYRFTAERFNMGQCPFGNNATLAKNAANLPEVIVTMMSNPHAFALLNELVREVLPQVREISIQARANNQVRIIVWPHDPATQRDDLAIPLDDCGSGVGQVLAILYVVMTSYDPQVIIVDEPQSFLHPGAVRKLIEVLTRYPQHQYIFATHSTTVITAAEPSTLTIVRASEAETSLQALEPESEKDLQSYLLEIGARLSDVFGADRILWVEGQTEEACFPKILRSIANARLGGTAIVGIRQTGDMTGKDKKKILEMYRRLSTAKTLLPPALAFVLDRECLTELRSDDVVRAGRDEQGRSVVHFLPRRMYENYLLQKDAIAAIVNGIAGFRVRRVTAEEVQQLLDKKLAEQLYYCPGLHEVPQDRLNRVDGASVLSDIFSELSENGASFDKMIHSVAITEWILEHSPEDLKGLSDWLSRLLPA
jgi:energy-coupling factor transporter ATP-binding protein EcfA2